MDLSKLDGLISAETGEVLSRFAGAVEHDLAIVEIGSFKGKSTCYLAQGAKDGNGAHVYAVDPWDTDGNETGRFGYAESGTREAFEKQVRKAKLWSYVTPLQGFSHNVSEKWYGPKVGLLFIDGDHARDSVVSDFKAWKPHLIKGESYVLFDDYTPRNHGVMEAINEELVQYFSHSRVEVPGLFRAKYEG